MEVQINYWAVFLAAASSMIVGAIWYAESVFGRLWAKLAKLDEKTLKKGAAGIMIVTFVLSLITAYVIAHVAYLSNAFFQHSFFQDAVTTAFWLWLGLVMTRILTHNLFEHRPARLNWLAIGNEFVTIMVMGMIIGGLKP